MGSTADQEQINAASDEWLQHPHEDLEAFYEGAVFTDEVTGKPLDKEGVQEARRLELEFVDRRPVYVEVPVQESYDDTRRGPIDTKSVDIDKGGPGNHKYSSRWIAKDFNNYQSDDFYAATPPYEAIKLLISLAASQKPRRGKAHVSGAYERRRKQDLAEMRKALNMAMRTAPEGARWIEVAGILKLALFDVSRAHFNGIPVKATYVNLPLERRRPGVCGRLVRNMYGTSGAAIAWENDYSERMKDWGFARGCRTLAYSCIRSVA